MLVCRCIDGYYHPVILAAVPNDGNLPAYRVDQLNTEFTSLLHFYSTSISALLIVMKTLNLITLCWSWNEINRPANHESKLKDCDGNEFWRLCRYRAESIRCLLAVHKLRVEHALGVHVSHPTRSE